VANREEVLGEGDGGDRPRADREFPGRTEDISLCQREKGPHIMRSTQTYMGILDPGIMYDMKGSCSHAGLDAAKVDRI
jgi:hypothetical protein